MLAGNLVGAFGFEWLIGVTPMVSGDLHGALAHVAQAGTSGGFVSVAYRAVFAGWLIALMAWLIASTRATGAQVMPSSSPDVFLELFFVESILKRWRELALLFLDVMLGRDARPLPSAWRPSR